MSNLETNKATVRAYYETAFAGQPELAVERYMGDRYIQHNPQADNGPAAFIRFVHELRSQNPELRLDIKRIFAEGDFVITHSHLFLKPGDSGLALADFFRLEKGKVVEHWDVIQPVPREISQPEHDVLSEPGSFVATYRGRHHVHRPLHVDDLIICGRFSLSVARPG